MKIRSKLFVLLVSLTLTSLLAASFVSINILSADTIRDIRSDLEHDSANLMNRISINTSNRISDITFLGHSINLFLNQSGTDLGKKLELLKKFLGTHKDYSSILIYNKTGIKIVGHNGIVIGENVSHKSFFKKAIQGNIYRGIAQSKSSEKDILLSGPIYDNSGKINGILVLSYPLDFKHASTGLQSNLRITLLSDDGKVIYSNYGNFSYGNRSLSNASPAASLEYQPIYRLIKDSNNTVESAIFKDIGFPSGNAIFVAAKESDDRQNPNSFTNKWILVTSSDTEEAFKAVLSLRNLFIFITLIVLAISIIAIYIVVDRTISIPLTKLKDEAIEIGKGNLDFMITSPSPIDEIGELSSQFGKMRARIKARTEELMRRDKELETANEQLRIRDKMQQDFINIAAHELRTPIQPILGSTGSLRSQITDTKQQALLEIIIRNAKRLKRLTDDILDVGKIESQLLQLNKEKIDLNEIISNVVKESDY